MKINSFRGDLSDISAVTAATLRTKRPHLRTVQCCLLMQTFESVLMALYQVVLPQLLLFQLLNSFFRLVRGASRDCDLMLHFVVVRFNLPQSGRLPAHEQNERSVFLFSK